MYNLNQKNFLIIFIYRYTLKTRHHYTHNVFFLMIHEYNQLTIHESDLFLIRDY
jgi:hypothetical protein